MDTFRDVRDCLMKAVRFDGQLRFDADYPDPRPGDDECLVRVRMAGICATDLHITRGYMNFQGVIGHEMVGVVEDGPANWVGKRVVCEINCVCRRCDLCLAGLSNHCRNRTVMGILGRDGCFAERVTVPVRNLHAVPEVLADEEAVFVEPLAAAYQVLAHCPIDRRTKVCVLGSGRLGLLVAQVLKTTGCQLIVIGRNHAKLEMCDKKGIQGLHVDHVSQRKALDVVVDCTGQPDGLTLAMSLVRPRGTIVLKSTCAEAAPVHLAPLVIDEITLLGSRCGPFSEAINALVRGVVDVQSLISRVFPLEKALDAIDAAGSPENLKVLLRVAG
jgi:threonine dehydrogenase-like Zn-dependent dehydrogenase